MSESAPVDAAARARALDPRESFIVQAPAGSGKTELLAQRLLRLLAQVGEPEQVLAITFTEKAVGEMRRRVLEALRAAAEPAPPPAAPHQRQTWELAVAALRRDQERHWGLLDNPARLAIRTLDSFSRALVWRMPWLSRAGGAPRIEKAPAPFYHEAAARTLDHLEEGGELADAVDRLLAHLDNNVPKLQELLAGILARREQWLRHIAAAPDREGLEAALGQAVAEKQAALGQRFPQEAGRRLVPLARFAAGNLSGAGQGWHTPLLQLSALPGAALGELPVWKGLSQLLLTESGTFRRRLTQKEGFPPKSEYRGPEKRLMEELLEELAGRPDLAPLLHEIRCVPLPVFDEPQWEVVAALLTLLPRAADELRQVFRAQGRCDFSEIHILAEQALEQDEVPTDLAFAIDGRIEHILVDEFQDTSIGQFELLTRLTQSWAPGDGRTLFLVGDPMQSIYLFREAEVGLFLTAQAGRLGQVPLTPLRLAVNFRSQRGIVEWVNQAFQQVFPERADILTGAVTYSPSVPFHDGGPEPRVTIHPQFLDRDRSLEAARVVELIQAARAADPAQKIAILVRAKAHLGRIIPALQAAGLSFQAIEIAALSELPLIQDLLALTRALVHPADRIAWLSVLRAPWCGLTLADLAVLGGAAAPSLWETLRDPAVRADLSEDGEQRLARVVPVLEAAVAANGRTGLRRRVEGTWIRLGGPACPAPGGSLEDAQSFFGLLEELEQAGGLDDLPELENRVAQLYALPDPRADERLQILSIHKAKGLEFDTVLLPGLDRIPRRDDPQLLYWLERENAKGRQDLLLAPIKRAGAEDDPLSEFIRQIQEAKHREEAKRLLYVAATRARRQLHLLGAVGLKATPEGEVLWAPAGGSLLRLLWPVVKDRFEQDRQGRGATLPRGEEAPAVPSPRPPRGLMRLPLGWSLPTLPEPVLARGSGPGTMAPEQKPPRFDWAGEQARHIGTVVHDLLEQIGREGVEAWDEVRIRARLLHLERALAALGVAPLQLNQAAARAVEALVFAVSDPTGRWILSRERQEAASEVALQFVGPERVETRVVDRTFVDGGVRWIVDFKTGSHAGTDREPFLDSEVARYRPQLDQYARLWSHLDPRPIKLGLYFPLVGGWRSWDFAQEQ